MKKIIFTLFVCLAIVSVHAQIANTKWKGTLHTNNPMDVIFDFSNDSFRVTKVEDNAVVETMTYEAKDTLLTIKKVYGQSDCDGVVIGKYRFEIKSNELYFKLVSDDCNDRSSVLDNSKWTKSQ